jgi:hypothetical protein
MSVTETEKTPRPPLIEQVLRFLVWFTILGCIATPVVVMLTVYGKVFGPFAGRGNDGLRQTVEQINFGNAAPKPKIVTSVLSEERNRQIARLRALTGRPEQASGDVASLQIIAVAFGRVKPADIQAPGPARQRVDEDGYRSLSLDLGQAPRDAVVILGDQPIRWRIHGLEPGSRPRIGFEGYAAFDVLDGQPGSLAGFSIGAFGANGFARAVDPTDGEISIRQTFCASLQNWTDHFGLPFDAVRFTLLLDPSRIAPNRGLPESDGEIAKTMYSADLDRLCRQRASR